MGSQVERSMGLRRSEVGPRTKIDSSSGGHQVELQKRRQGHQSRVRRGGLKPSQGLVGGRPV